MSTTAKPAPAVQTSSPNQADTTSTYFHQQRALLVSEIATALDTTLTQLNRLNRSLESVTAVGNEFSSVEALWSQFEGVMGNMPQNGGEQPGRAAGQEEGSDGEPVRRGGEDGVEEEGAEGRS